MYNLHLSPQSRTNGIAAELEEWNRQYCGGDWTCGGWRTGATPKASRSNESMFEGLVAGVQVNQLLYAVDLIAPAAL